MLLFILSQRQNVLFDRTFRPTTCSKHLEQPEGEKKSLKGEKE